MYRMGMLKCMAPMAITIGIGYILCVLAEKQKGNLKKLGYVLGIGILVVSLATAVLCASKIGCKMAKGGLCGMSKMSENCPMKK